MRNLEEVEKLLKGQHYRWLKPEENLNELLARAETEVRRFGITHDQIADRLEWFTLLGKQAERDLRYSVPFDQNARSKYERINAFPDGFLLRGFAPEDFLQVDKDYAMRGPWVLRAGGTGCPWPCNLPNEYNNTSALVRNLQTGERVGFRGDDIHYVRHHKFYRDIDVIKDWVRVLGIEPGVNYKFNKVEETNWYDADYPEDREGIKDNPTTVYELPGDAKAYVRGNSMIITSPPNVKFDEPLRIGTERIILFEPFIRGGQALFSRLTDYRVSR